MCKAQKVHVKSIISARVVEARVMTSREKRLTGKRAFGSFSCFVSRLVAFRAYFSVRKSCVFRALCYKADLAVKGSQSDDDWWSMVIGIGSSRVLRCTSVPAV